MVLTRFRDYKEILIFCLLWMVLFLHRSFILLYLPWNQRLHHPNPNGCTMCLLKYHNHSFYYIREREDSGHGWERKKGRNGREDGGWRKRKWICSERQIQCSCEEQEKVSEAFYYCFYLLLHWREKPKRVFIEEGKRGFLQRKP